MPIPVDVAICHVISKRRLTASFTRSCDTVPSAVVVAPDRQRSVFLYVLGYGRVCPASTGADMVMAALPLVAGCVWRWP